MAQDLPVKKVRRREGLSFQSLLILHLVHGGIPKGNIESGMDTTDIKDGGEVAGNRLDTTSSGERGLLWFALFLFIAPTAALFLVLNWQVPLAPLVGMDSLCAKCDRKATRTLRSAADALRTRGVYVYDRNRYPKAAPAWCDQHDPDPAPENAGHATAVALGVFAMVILVYKILTHWLRCPESL